MEQAQQNSAAPAEAPAPPAAAPKVPRGTCVYAVGDIHGRDDLLAALHRAIREDAKARSSRNKVIVHLGDYVDRGPDSFAVVERLVAFAPEDFRVVNLKGNHEDFLIKFLAEKPGRNSIFDVWLLNGGAETMRSYGLDVEQKPYEAGEIDRIRTDFAAALPDSHRRFYKSLTLRCTIGDYLFVHAGVNPDLPLKRQRKGDLLWIRDRFLAHAGPFDKVVVHGHTIFPTPEILDHRIGIDTGAYYSGRLTCLAIDGAERHFIET